MDIDFNNLRKQTAYSLSRVIDILNDGILPEKEFASYNKPNGEVKHVEGDVLVNKSDLQREINFLRENIWVLLCCYKEGDPNYQCVFEEVEKTGGISRFNEDEF